MIRALLSTIVIVAWVTTVRADDPVKTDLFTADTDGYAIYRIPGIVVTPKGSLLVYCEARKTRSDWAAIDPLVRRSTDGGKTWEPARKLPVPDVKFEKNPAAVARKSGKPGTVTVNNIVMIPDAATGAVHCLYCVEYMRCFYTRSDDDGKSFAEPTEITATFDRFRPGYDWKVLATGPGHGVRLKSGRLVVPVWLSRGTEGNGHNPSCVATVYSDDAGRTWLARRDHRGRNRAAHQPERNDHCRTRRRAGHGEPAEPGEAPASGGRRPGRGDRVVSPDVRRHPD